MTLKTCPNCKKQVTSKEVKYQGRDSTSLHFRHNSCNGNFVLRDKRWQQILADEMAKESTASALMNRVASFLIVVTTISLLSGCATSVYQPEVSHFDNPQNRSLAQIKVDQYRCGMDSDGIEARDMEYFNACMETKGYKRVVDRQATMTEQPFKFW